MQKDEEDCLIYSDQVKEAMEADPKLAEAMRIMAASMRQAQHVWKSGQYATFEDAMEAITGNRPTLIGDEEFGAINIDMG